MVDKLEAFIVMNTQAEIRQAMADLKNGTFIKPAH